MQSRSDDVNYKVVITTPREYRERRFDGRIFIRLVGGDGDQTQQQEITEYFKPGEAPRQTFNLKLRDIGIPKFIKFDIVSPENDEWACDDVVVMYGDSRRSVRFPVYDWIRKELTVAAGKAYAYTEADQELKDVRSMEITEAKRRFQWTPRAQKKDEIGWGIPRYVDAKAYCLLPKVFKWKMSRENGIVKAGIEAIYGSFMEWIDAIWESIFGNFSLDSYKKFYKHIESEDPPFIDRWDTDKEFGRQQIMGVSPLALKRLTDWPQGCKITNKRVKDFLGGKSLEEAKKEGKIFIGDYSTVFSGVARNRNVDGEQLYCPDAIGLFHADQDGDIVPIAIQLVPGDTETVFTPKDRKDDWMLAKMYYRTAASNLHEWYYHFLLTHNVMEPFAVALFRNVPRSHPLYKLLRPHLQTVSAINTEARNKLIGPGTKANEALAILGLELVQSTFKEFNMSHLNLPKVLKKRGLDDKNAMPKNYFREDAMKLWTVIDKFVESLLQLYYSSDKDVADDKDIQAFAEDVANEGFGWQDGNARGMETEFKNLKRLIELCTILIYTSSVGHAAVNFPQFQIYQFIPNSPVGMRREPHKRGKADMQRILDSLPDKETSMLQIAIAYTLCDRISDETYLGQYPMKLFTDENAQAVIRTFQKGLKDVEKDIKKRNETAGDDAYDFLLPSRIPNSIAI